MHKLPATALTLLVGAAGGSLLYVLNAPAAFLTGSALAVTGAVLAHLPVHLPDKLRFATFSVLGVMMGAAITPEALMGLATFPLALLGLVIVVTAATFASYVVLRRVGRWDRLSALLGSVPGNFSLVMAISVETGARMERVVMAQVFRLFVLVSLVPFVFGGSAEGMRAALGSDHTAVDVALTLAIGLAAAYGARFLRLPAAAMLGPLLVSAVLSGTGLVTIAVPYWLAAGAFVVLGASVAARFGGMQRGGFGRMLLASFASFIVAFTIAMVTAFVFAEILSIPVGAVFLAYAPGGLDAMIAISFLLGYDVAFVAILHAARMLILAIGLPLLIRPVTQRQEADERAPP